MESVFKSIDLDPNPTVRHATSSPLIPTIASPQSPSDSSSKGSREELDLMDALDDMQSYGVTGSTDSIASENIYDSVADKDKKAALERPPPIPKPRVRNYDTESESVLPPPLPPSRPRGSSLLNQPVNKDGVSMDEPDGDENSAPPPLPKKSSRRVSSQEQSY